jgi:hypothetical protein
MKRLTWLHLSDLHYGKPGESWDADDIQRKLVKDLKDLKKNKELCP